MQWMIYGANGYTGEMIAREAKARGQAPVLAGRSADQVERLAVELGLEFRSFALDSASEVDRGLRGIELVLHCAGPFSRTSAPMVDGCLRARAHYLDITGEISVFEHAHAQHAHAQQAGIVVCPGAGFDVIPTDCVALALKEALPDATHLVLGFEQPAVLSPGTANTTVQNIGRGGAVRRAGKIVAEPLAHSTRRIDFGNGLKTAMSHRWGDVSTAYYTTGIGNIQVFIAASKVTIFAMKAANLIRPLLRMKSVVAALQRRIGRTVKGPDREARGGMPAFVWGEAVNAKGEKRCARIKTANGYSLTVTGSLEIVQYLLHNQVRPGTYTPSMLMGSQFVARLPGSGALTITAR